MSAASWDQRRAERKQADQARKLEHKTQRTAK